MSLDLSFEELFTDDEIRTLLKIDNEDLREMEAQGLPFIEAGGKHFYLGSSMTTYFKGAEITQDVGKPQKSPQTDTNTPHNAPGCTRQHATKRIS